MSRLATWWRAADLRPRAGDAPIWAISLGHAGTHWYLGAFAVVLPYFQRDLGLSNAELGLLLSLRAVTSTLVNLPAGTLVDLIGRRGLVMAVALAWCGLPYLALGLSDNLLVTAVALAMVGIGNNLWHPAALSTLSESYPQRRGFALSIHAMGANVGDAVAPAVVGLLLQSFGWREVVVANVIPGIALAVVIWLMLRGAGRAIGATRRQPLPPSAYLRGLAQIGRNTQLAMLALLSGVRALTQQALTFVLPLYLANTLLLAPALVGLYLALVQGAGIVASPLSGAVSDRAGRKPIVMAGMTITSLLVVGLIVVNSGPLFAAVLGLLGFFMFAMRPVLFAWTMESTPPELGGTTVGIVFGSQAFFGIFAPLISGWLADSFGMLSVFYFIAATVLVGNLITVFIPERAPAPDR